MGNSVHSTLFPRVAICTVVFGTAPVSVLFLDLRDSEILLQIALHLKGWESLVSFCSRSSGQYRKGHDQLIGQFYKTRRVSAIAAGDWDRQLVVA